MPFNYMTEDELFGDEPQPEDSVDDFEYMSANEAFAGEDFEAYKSFKEAKERELEETRQSIPEMGMKAFGRLGQDIVSTSHNLVAGLDQLPYSVAMAIKKRVDPEGYKILMDNEDITKQIFEERARGTLGPAAGFVVPDEELQERMRAGAEQAEDIRESWFGKSRYSKEKKYSVDWWLEGSADVVAQLGEVIAINSAAPGLGLAAIGTQAGVAEYDEARQRLMDRGWDPNDAETLAFGEGLVIGVLETALEKLPVDAITKIPGANKHVVRLAAERAFQASGGEALEEVASEFVGDVMQYVAEQDPDAFENWQERYGQAAAFGAIGGAVVAGPVIASDVSQDLQIQATNAVITPEGREGLRSLGEVENPSRKDFENAGITARLSAPQRKQYAKELSKMADEVESAEQELIAPAAAQETEVLPEDARQTPDAIAEDIPQTPPRGVEQTAPPPPTVVQEEAAIHPTGEAVSFARTRTGERTDTAPTVPRDYVKGGKVRIYQRATQDLGETTTIPPTGPIASSLATETYQAAETPRSAFFLNTSDIESPGEQLYSAEVAASDIYNLVSDPQGLKEKHRTDTGFDFDAIFNELQTEGKKGVYYNPGTHVVNMFEPVESTRSQDVTGIEEPQAAEISDVIQEQMSTGRPVEFAYSPSEGSVKTQGYTVDLDPRNERSFDVSQTPPDQIPQVIQQYAGSVAEELSQADAHISGRIDGNTLKLNVATVSPSESEATAAAEVSPRARVRDLGTGRSVTEEAPVAEARAKLKNEYEWNVEKGNISPGPTISRREAVQRILDMVGVTAGDNFKGMNPKTVGFYKWINAIGTSEFPRGGGKEVNIRKSELDNIGVAVHEVAHMLDDMYNITGESLTARAGARQESMFDNLSFSEKTLLSAEDYDKNASRPAEGWAEGLRLYVMNQHPGQGFRTEHAFSAFEKIIHHPDMVEVRDMANQMRATVEEYMRQPLAMKIQQAMSSGRGGVTDPGESYFARNDRRNWMGAMLRSAEKTFVNNMSDLEYAEKQIESQYKDWWDSLDDTFREGIDSDQAWDMILRETRGLPSQLKMNYFNMTSKLADEAVFEKMVDYEGNDYGEAASDIFKGWSQDKLDTFGQYMYSKVSLQRHAASIDPDTGIASYLPGEATIENMQQFVAENETPEFQETADRVTSWFNNLLRMMKDNDLIEQEDYDRMVEAHELYMPFYRQFSDEHHPLGSKFLEVEAPIRKLGRGSVMPVLDVYDAMVDRAHETFGAINRKLVEESFVDVFEKSGMARQFLSRSKEPGEGTITIKRGGEKIHYKVDPDIYQVMSSSGSVHLSKPAAKILAAIGSFTDFGRMMMVNMNVLYFPWRNIARDMKTAAIKGLQDTTGLSKDASIGVIARSGGAVQQIVAGAKQAYNPDYKTDVDKLYELDGGAHNTRLSTSRQAESALKYAKRRAMKKQAFGGGRSMLTEAARIIKNIQIANDIAELSARKAAHLATLVGLSKTTNEFNVTEDGTITGKVPMWARSRAMYNAMEITTNFNRRGRWANVLEPVTIFYNAAMQGSRSQLSTIQNAVEWKDGKFVIKDKRAFNRIAAGMTMSVMAKGLALATMAAMSDPEDEERSMLDWYFEIPDYYKKTQDVFMANIGGAAVGLSLPNEREWNFVGHIGEELLWKPFFKAMGYDVGTTMFDEDAGEFTEKTRDGILEEIFDRVPASGGAIPVALQLMTGYDFFRAETIEGRYDYLKPTAERYDERSQWAHPLSNYGLSQTFGLSPKEIDFVSRNMIGSMTGNVINFTQSLSDENMTKWSKVPVAGPFIVDPVPRASISDYYRKSANNSQQMDLLKKGVLSDKQVEKVLESEAVFGVTDRIKRVIRDSDMNDYDKQKYTTGIARWALGRKPSESWPNPISKLGSEDIPNPVRVGILEAMKGGMRMPRIKDTSPEGIETFKKKVEAKKKTIRKIAAARS